MEPTKTILWVEDFDEQNPTSKMILDDLDNEPDDIDTTLHTSKIPDVFPEEHCYRVDLQETVIGALNAIDTNLEHYDCIVLDVNLIKGYPNETARQDEIKERLETAGIVFPPDIVNFKKNTGYYLYLYLLCKGFPKDRVIMRTAYNKSDADNLTVAWNDKFTKAGLRPPTSVDKPIPNNPSESCNQKFHDELHKLYPSKLHSTEHDYYRIRRHLLDAINHWTETINNEICDTNSFIFNTAVTDNKLFNKSDFLLLLNDIKSIFSVPQHTKSKNIFSDVLRKLSTPFEAFMNYNKVSENQNAFTYLSIMRLMRNWYAHNVFSQNEPEDEEFLLLIIIAFRALFDDKSSHQGIFDYEKNIFSYLVYEEPLKQDKVIAEETVYCYFRDTYKKIIDSKNLDPKYKIFSTEYWRLLDSLGQDKSDHSECNYRKFIELIWASKYPIALNFQKFPKIKQTDNYPDSTTVYFNYPVSGNDIPDNPDILDLILRVDYSLKENLYIHKNRVQTQS